MKKSTLKISLIALTACFICICAQIAIPLGGVPLTLQTFAVAFCGYTLGKYSGTLSCLIYLSLGAIGLPVFAGFGASLAFLFGPTGGFLFGFLFLAFFCGSVSSKASVLFSFLISLIGLLICHLLGIFWFSHISDISLAQSFLLSSLPYLLKDILSLIFARVLFCKLLQRYPQFSFFRSKT
ncbi:MAG: biotin transporter BioY [Ruminococcaceae bacterium]|nr:biotin transporter BioY [Oscillospiraceae bacterium]